MKCRAFKLLLFVLAGAIINVVVAFGFAFKSRNGSQKSIQEIAGTNTSSKQAAHVLISPGYRGEMSVGIESHSLAIRMKMLDSRGWPLPSMRSEQVVKRSTSNVNGQWVPINDLAIRYGIDVGPADDLLLSGGSRRLIPLLPLFPGFAINTIFYAAILYALFAVPGAVRRRLRHKRGQCASCGYSLRESVSEKCPECGAAK